MIAIARFRELLGPEAEGKSDKELLELRNGMYDFARIAVRQGARELIRRTSPPDAPEGQVAVTR